MTPAAARVSVIIPTYNRKHWLGECLGAIAAQTLRPCEILVVDDGSVDGTVAALAPAFPQVRFLRLPRRGGPAAARNAGLDAATGDFLAFCDSDDLWLPNKLARQIAVARETGAGLVCSDGERLGEPGQGYLAHYRWRFQALRHQLIWDNFIITSSVVVRRAALAGLRFPEDPRHSGYEDYALWLRLAGRTRIALLPERLLRYRVHAASLSAAARGADARNQRWALVASGALAREPLLVALRLARTTWATLRAPKG